MVVVVVVVAIVTLQKDFLVVSGDVIIPEGFLQPMARRHKIHDAGNHSNNNNSSSNNDKQSKVANSTSTREASFVYI